MAPESAPEAAAPSRAAEEHVLGAILLDPERWPQVADLTLANFGFPEHRALFQTLSELAANGGIQNLEHVIDALATTERLSIVGGAERVRRLHDDTATGSTIAHYADIVRATRVEPTPKPKRHTRSKPLAATPGATLRPDGAIVDTGSSYVQWQSLGLDCNGSGTPFPSLGNTAIILASHPELAGKIWLDTFRKQIWHALNGEPMVFLDADALRLTAWINQSLRLAKIGIMTVQRAVELVAANTPRNSVTEYLESLVWDGTERLDSWLSDCLGVTKTAYTMAVGRNWLISMVARAYVPGCQVDHMPVLEGLSGAGKSSALAILGGPWYKAAPQAFGSKEFLEAIQGAWLTEIPDMVGFGRREHSQIISAITTRSDVYRASYGRIAEEHPRTTIFAATSETDEYLDDTRGKRRYWPLRCTAIDLDLLKALRDQLFAEATAAFKVGKTWHEVPSEEAESEQSARQICDVWVEPVEKFTAGRTSVTIAEVVRDCLGIEYGFQDRSCQMRVSKILKSLGFAVKVEGVMGKIVRIYRR